MKKDNIAEKEKEEEEDIMSMSMPKPGGKRLVDYIREWKKPNHDPYKAREKPKMEMNKLGYYSEA